MGDFSPGKNQRPVKRHWAFTSLIYPLTVLFFWYFLMGRLDDMQMMIRLLIQFFTIFYIIWHVFSSALFLNDISKE